MHVRKGDLVQVISGDERGKTGKVKRVIPKKQRVLVEGINYITKHLRPSQKNPKGGRVKIEAPMTISNVLPVCPDKNCKKHNKGVRTRIKFLGDGEKVRTCVACGSEIVAGE